jgi:hypothetical protein
MCKWGGFTNDPWTYACCTPDNPSDYCQPSDFNECTPSYTEIKERFFTYCPLINNTMCGMGDTEDVKMEFIAKNEKQTFSFDRLRWKDKYYKLP